MFGRFRKADRTQAADDAGEVHIMLTPDESFMAAGRRRATIICVIVLLLYSAGVLASPSSGSNAPSLIESVLILVMLWIIVAGVCGYVCYRSNHECLLVCSYHIISINMMDADVIQIDEQFKIERVRRYWKLTNSTRKRLWLPAGQYPELDLELASLGVGCNFCLLPEAEALNRE